MFPLAFIDVGNTLPPYVLSADAATTSYMSPSSLSATSPSSSSSAASSNNATTNAITITSTQTAFIDGDNATYSIGSLGSESMVNESMAMYVPPIQRPETIFIVILYTLIFIVGVLGNGTLVIIFFRHRSMRNIPNTYILSLALADLLVILVCVPLATLVYTTDSWTFGKNMCQITEFFKDVSIGVSVFTLTALSGERYCAIVNPLRKLQTKPLTVITATMIWLLSIMFATPALMTSNLQSIEINSNLTIIICNPYENMQNISDTYSSYMAVTKAFVYYLLPLVIIGVLYLMMAQRLHVSARDMPGETLSMQSRSQIRARRYVARMVVVFVVVFFACFFPYHVFELWYYLNPKSEDEFDIFWHVLRIFGFFTSFLNSCANPVALYCVSGAFRAHFNQYLCCWCVKRQTRIRQHSTATGMMDTSIVNMSMRSTTNYNRASVHFNNANSFAGGGGGAINGTNGNSGGRLTSGYRRTSSMQLHHKHHHNGGDGHLVAQSGVILSGDKR